jgi:membrane protein
MNAFVTRAASQVRLLVQALRVFPWRRALGLLRTRFAQDQLALTASSLTFTTTIALVPLITVALAVFTAFPMFAKLQTVLQQWLVDSLVPDNIARQVLGYLTQFAGKASRLGTVGLVALLGTALALVLTIDRTLNRIWRVQRVRPLRQRVLIYWAVLTLGPLLLAVVLTITSYLLTASRTVVGAPAGGLRLLLGTLELLLLAAGMAALFKNVPHTHVRWSHAWVGGVLVSTGFELAKKGLALYLAGVPSYNAVYGAFATLPILLVWMYLAWTIVLIAAEIVACLPALLDGHLATQPGSAARPPEGAEALDLALRVLQNLQLNMAPSFGNFPENSYGMTQQELAGHLGVEASDLEPVLLLLAQLDRVGRVEEIDADRAPRYVLLRQAPVGPQ